MQIFKKKKNSETQKPKRSLPVTEEKHQSTFASIMGILGHHREEYLSHPLG